MSTTALTPIANLTDVLATMENNLSEATRHAYAQELSTLSAINKTLCAVKWDASRKNSHAVGLLALKQVSAFKSALARTRRGASVRTVRDRAIIAFGIATALRAVNLAELKLNDLTPTLTYDGLLVTVRWGKTDQTGQGYTVPVKASTNALLDPIRAINEWLTVLAAHGYTKQSHPDFPLFPVLRGNNIKQQEIAHPTITLTNTVRINLTDAGITGGQYTSHTLRSTFITLSSQAGVSERSIATVSGHKSMTVLRAYDRTALEQFAQTDYPG